MPGNHDCDFARHTEMRDLVITNLPEGNALNFSGDIVGNCLSVHEHFFEFMKAVTGRSQSGSMRLYEKRFYTINGGTIEFNLYNTAWLSRKHEKPGTLLFPVSLASDLHSGSEPADVAVALLHHPFNWFEPTNARTFRALLKFVWVRNWLKGLPGAQKCVVL